MEARNVMSKEVVCVGPMYGIEESYQLMQKHQIRHLPVVVAERIKGIVSDRDLLRVALHRESDNSLHFPKGTIAQVMSKSPWTVNFSTTVSDIAELFLDNKIDCAPVVSDDAILEGLVTSSDLIALLIDDERMKAPLPFKFKLQLAEAVA